MPLFEIPKASSKVKATISLEQSTADSLDRYAAYSKASADDVIDQALQYVFRKDKDFQKHLAQTKDETPEQSLKIAARPGRKTQPTA